MTQALEKQDTVYRATPLSRTLSVTALYSLHYFAYVKRFRFAGESHPFYELIYCDSGEAVIHDNEKEYKLKQGELFLHAPDHYHDVSTGDTFTNVTVIGFHGSLSVVDAAAGKVLATDGWQKSLLRALVEAGRCALIEPLNIVYQPVFTVRDDLPLGAMQQIGGLLELLLISLLRAHANTLSALPKPEGQADKSRNYHQSVAAQVVTLLKENLSESIRLEDVAHRFGFSTAYIKRIFSSVMGCGILQYFNRLKIERAKQLMSESAYTVSQISEQLGFSSLQYFSRQFRRFTNMSPTQYLSSLRLGGVL